MSEETVLTIALPIDSWTVEETISYRHAIGVNALYAADELERALSGGLDEARAEFGEKVDEDGWEPPDGWSPRSISNLDPEQLLGFCWISARRKDSSLDFGEFAKQINYGSLMDAFWEFLAEAATPLEEEETPPPQNRATRRASGQRSKSKSRSRTSSAGHSEASGDSPSESTNQPDDSATE